jgi:hypothetical protein
MLAGFCIFEKPRNKLFGRWCVGRRSGGLVSRPPVGRIGGARCAAGTVTAPSRSQDQLSRPCHRSADTACMVGGVDRVELLSFPPFDGCRSIPGTSWSSSCQNSESGRDWPVSGVKQCFQSEQRTNYFSGLRRLSDDAQPVVRRLPPSCGLLTLIALRLFVCRDNLVARGPGGYDAVGQI